MVFPHVQQRDKSVKNRGKFLPQQSLRSQLIHQLHEDLSQHHRQQSGRVHMILVELLPQDFPLFFHLFVFYSIWFGSKWMLPSEKWGRSKKVQEYPECKAFFNLIFNMNG